jgi:hypothetical protein
MLLKRWLVGNPIKTAHAAHERLSKSLALAIFSSNSISSVAYATEEILLVLILAGTAALAWSIPVSLAILFLVIVLTISYRQIIYEYPEGGGAYIVARSNLGEMPALIAAAALMIDYVLTVAVSDYFGHSGAVCASGGSGTHLDRVHRGRESPGHPGIREILRDPDIFRDRGFGTDGVDRDVSIVHQRGRDAPSSQSGGR